MASVQANPTAGSPPTWTGVGAAVPTQEQPAKGVEQAPIQWRAATENGREVRVASGRSFLSAVSDLFHSKNSEAKSGREVSSKKIAGFSITAAVVLGLAIYATIALAMAGGPFAAIPLLAAVVILAAAGLILFACRTPPSVQLSSAGEDVPRNEDVNIDLREAHPGESNPPVTQEQDGSYAHAYPEGQPQGSSEQLPIENGNRTASNADFSSPMGKELPADGLMPACFNGNPNYAYLSGFSADGGPYSDPTLPPKFLSNGSHVQDGYGNGC